MQKQKGTVSTRILKRSVLRHIKKEVPVGTKIGDDFSVLNPNTGLLSAIGAAASYEVRGLNPQCESTEPTVFQSVALLALLRAGNHIAMAGARIESVSILIVASEETPEAAIREEMSALAAACKKRNIIIAGGNTIYSGEGDSYTFQIVANGHWSYAGADIPEKAFYPVAVAAAGDQVLYFGNAGSFGAEQILRRNYTELSGRFSKHFLTKVIHDEKDYDLQQKAASWIAVERELAHMKVICHAGGTGGVYRLAYELSEKTGFGIRIHHEKIPILQESIELAEVKNVNPYLASALGSFAVLTRKEHVEKLLHDAAAAGIKGCLLGELTMEKGKLVVSEAGWNRAITLFEGDKM